ncbi:ferrous iron transporter B [Fischerella thermalis CCMEE 5198]|jgi:ferrous iron transport protein B|uniref:ferrous iron transporter B n=1 Tax=Fischerella thermalis TaxID=372787 RepID=UPI000C7FD8A6|nr:ferrous iron transporter B [Fischerella thermalis]PLZ94524.1 ferrous iron transporter B [Fischerella thermalis CCMEE 5196]PMB20580.1 ferrous iron transporter B [Fischerella thermalis CCMEE 5198]PMB52386.1 ferrous iron transporter B [Fischerella thermalis CCMEE 5201]
MAHCHDSSSGIASLTSQPGVKRVAVMGMPNVGKSTLFNRITGAGAFVGNWPGVTVDLLEAEVELEGRKVEFVDLPGIYDLEGYSEDERVVQSFFETYPVDLVLVILNAAQIDRQIRLPLQVKALGIPAVVILNMADEAKHFGITIDEHKLADKLEMPVVLVSAKYGSGYAIAIRKIIQELAEERVPIAPTQLKRQIEAHPSISELQIREILEESVEMPSRLFKTVTERLDAVLLHPVIGLPLFFLSIYLMFEFVWLVGLPLQDVADAITGWLQEVVIAPVTVNLSEFWRGFLVDGIYGGLATVASFIPLVITFFFMMAIVEDSGYFSRAAYMMDSLMYRFGMDGRSFVLLIMGFGCNIPPIMGTRVMRSRALRLLTILIIPFALCSARLTVFVFIIDALFDRTWGPLVLFSLYLFSFLVALLTGLLMKRQFQNREPFVIELPPYRFPTLQQIFLRGWGELKHFLQRATGFITAGVAGVWLLSNLPQGTANPVGMLVITPLLVGMVTGWDAVKAFLQRAGGLIAIGVLGVWLLTHLPGNDNVSYATRIGEFFAPILNPAGIPKELTIALLFGFIAKEILVGSLATIYNLTDPNAVQATLAQTISPIQAYSFMLFCLLYTPCLATVATIRSESKSIRFTFLSVTYGLIWAWVVSTLFYQGARLLGLS